MRAVNFLHFDTLDSTNNWVKAHAHTLDPAALSCVSATEQTAGRGRLNRTWLSPRGENLYATFYFCASADFPYFSNVGQVASMACCELLEELGFAPQIKWPNDLLLEGKKVGGVLCETAGVGVIVGVGLNINMPQETLDTINQSATSLLQIAGRRFDILPLLHALTAHMGSCMEQLEQGGFAPLHAVYTRHLARIGSLMKLQQGDTLWKGVFQGVDAQGRLVLQLEDGTLKPFSSGELV